MLKFGFGAVQDRACEAARSIAAFEAAGMAGGVVHMQSHL
jgi:hypothetical protein